MQRKVKQKDNALMLNQEIVDFDALSIETSPAFRSSAPLGRTDAWEFDFPVKSCSAIEIRGLFEDLHDKIQRLESDFVRMQNQLKRSNQHGHSHCTQLAEVCKDLENFFLHDADVFITNPVDESGFEGPSQDSLPSPDALSDPVRNLLHNFREEIERQGERTERRLNLMETNLAELKQTISENHNQALLEVKMCVEKYTENMLQRFSLERKASLEDLYQPLRDHIALLEREITRRLDQAQCFCNENIDMRIQGLHAELAESAARKATSSAKVESIHHCVRALESSMQEMVDKWDSQQIQLSRDVHEAHLCIQHQQDELKRMNETLKEHGEQITELQRNVPLDGAFQEIKDWLTDLEKRAVNHGGMQKQKQSVEAQLAELRKDLHLATSKTDRSE
ncbi:unnamed protein product [Phytomonas sp. EM1]|nr:unnamed protein product [Phytomonas sp. EM1]|eukprot:CCW63852.1 unnamed protein product [Phytomonas sp. isolate EM1]